MNKYYINSNSGDYIIESNGKYTLNLISRYPIVDGVMTYQPHESIEITPSQFHALKGFIPIKEKKLFNNRVRKNYAPTNSDGTKGRSERIQVPTKAETRDEILKSLGL